MVNLSQADKPTLHAQVREATDLLTSGQLGPCRRAVNALKSVTDEIADVWALDAELALRERRPQRAVESVDRALALEPDAVARHVQRARCYLLAGDAVTARASAEEALARGVERLDHLLILGGVLVRCEQHELALSVYERASQRAPDSADAWRGMASVCRFTGRLEEAEQALDNAIRLAPEDYESIGMRSSLRTWTPDDNHIAMLQQLENAGIANWRGRVQVAFALAKELEDLGEYKASFASLRRGAETKRKHTLYDHADDLKIFPSIEAAFSRDAIEENGYGHPSQEPIFVVGMPRTGSTLVERIITAHSSVQNLGELSNFSIEMVRMVREQLSAQSVDRLELAAKSVELPMYELGYRYLASVQPMRSDVPRFVDKLPLNSLNIGLIHSALPNARIVHVVRHPLDACYAMYKYLFRNGYPFSYDLKELGAYYVEYWQLMEHWRAVLPEGRIYDVHYEAVVDDLEGSAKHLIDHLELPWEPGCIRFHKSSEASMTGSATQVRKPIYASSVGKWQRYEKELEPLRQVLQEGGVPV
ncbi:sulfotransferase [Luminiphilus sp.]|nr:tetratricopeptide repeat-containing sulfotransferase family protein [Luminiphilus sp.]MDA9722038.1 sulfotransferase [Luminiphilus sp.]